LFVHAFWRFLILGDTPKKILGKLVRLGTTGVNFINVLQAAFVLADPKSAKETVKLSVFFALLGSALAKAAHKTLVKLTPVEKN